MSETPTKTLYLLDAYALIYRAYYAFIRNPRINSKGLNTSAIYGFANSLLEIITKEKPTHIAVAFDPAGPTFRHEMYVEYKAHRDETPEDIRKAIPVIKQMLAAMNITVIEKAGYEADDVIGTLAGKAERLGFNVFMVTPDKDYTQLVTDNIKIYKPSSSGSGAEILGIQQVCETFSVERPSQVIDILGLWGDSADNIPGCPGVGEKKAKELIATFSSIEGIYEHIDQLKGKQKENLIEFRQQVELSKVLATIHTEVPVEIDEQLLIAKKPNTELLSPLFEELEFKALSARIRDIYNPAPMQRSLFDMEPAAAAVEVEQPITSYKTINDIPHKYYLIDNDLALISLRAELSTKKEFCFDTETTGLNTESDELVGMSFSWQPHEAYYVLVPADKAKANEIVSSFKSILEDKNILKIGQNLKFDILMLRQYNINVQGPFFDTMVAHHIVNPGLKHNMDFLSETYLDYRPVAIEDLIGKKGKTQGNMRNVPIEKIKEYAGEDADITLQLKHKLKEEITKEGLTQLFEEVEMPLMKVLEEMEFTGVKVDAGELNLFSIELRKRIETIENNIYALAGENFNIASPKQVGELLFDRLKLDPQAKKTKTGQYSTDEETLQKLKGKHPIVDEILTHRGLKKLLSTYAEALPALINAKTQRLHTSYNQALVVTGRLSSNNPNLQNIPIRDDDGREIRKAFVAADADHLFLSADYSQVELRIMSHMSGDEHLISAFNNGEDIHAATAGRIFNIPVSEVTSDMRRKAKTANFGIIYGIAAFGLSERLGIPRTEAKGLIDGYFENFPGVKTYMDQCIREAREKGFVTTLSGRKRYLPDINSRNQVVRGVAERNAINAPIQGTAADIIKIAMVKIAQAFEKNNIQSKMILQVHDELNFDVIQSELEAVKKIVKEEMESAFQLKVPLVADMGVGSNWLQAH